MLQNITHRFPTTPTFTHHLTAIPSTVCHSDIHWLYARRAHTRHPTPRTTPSTLTTLPACHYPFCLFLHPPSPPPLEDKADTGGMALWGRRA